jgi:hypothetical protein
VKEDGTLDSGGINVKYSCIMICDHRFQAQVWQIAQQTYEILSAVVR